MFTGIIKKEGVIKKIDNKKNGKYFIIEAKGFLRNVKIGGSISCDGVCLTVINKKKDKFKVELMPETLKLTKFKNTKICDSVNLELALKLGGRINGHFVMGHIDGVGKIKEVKKDGKYRNIIIKVPKKIIKYIANKGSITVNGVSLTVSGVGLNWFKVSLITYTLENTNLSELKIGDLANVEIDMMARYLERLLAK